MLKELIVNERVTLLQPISTRDTAGTLVVPDSIRYRIQDVESRIDIKPWTDLSLSSQQDIEVTPEENRIITDTNAYEERVITVEFWYYSNTRSGKDELRYKVKNLYGVGPSSSPSASWSPSSSASPS